MEKLACKDCKQTDFDVVEITPTCEHTCYTCKTCGTNNFLEPGGSVFVRGKVMYDPLLSSRIG